MLSFGAKRENNFLNKFLRYYFVILLVLVVFIAGLLLGSQTNKSVNNNNFVSGKVADQKVKPGFLSKDVNFDLFWETWDTIRKNYVHQPVSETEMLYGAMAGSVASLGDPHSIFFDPDTTKKFTDELQGTFDGIGTEIAIKNDRLTIIAPLPGSPAEKAGLRAGDQILAIDAEDTAGMSLDYAVNKIRGQKGTDVVLTVNREGWDKAKEIKLTRDTIKIQSVKWKMLDNNLAYINLRYFNEDTSSEFNKAVVEIISKNPKGIVFDLRNNPGGYLDTAIDVASEWVDKGVVVYEKSADGKLKANEANGQARFKDFPTVVLINGGSASGSEIVAGALKDYKLATLIGEKSFGKGSVQTLFPLEDGSSIKLTIALWLTPNENTIDGEGIEPDIQIKLTDEDFNADKDPQLDRAILYLNQNNLKK
jgi:carboxyl-terminal processing protease